MGDEEPDRTDYARGEEGMKFHKEAAEREPAWKGVGLEVGLKIWRIEYFQVVPVDEDSYGKFYVGDSYIILQTKMQEGGKLLHDIYFWLGKETSIDERGTAAYKTVELDDFFGDEPVQHRECQESGETDEFKALFPDGIEYLEGGCPSGFRHVAPAGYEARLYQARYHKKEMEVVRIPLTTSALNPGDSFILDTESAIYVLNGPQADKIEEFEANRKAEELKNERAGKASIQDVDDAFWSALEGDKPEWATAKTGGYVDPSKVPVSSFRNPVAPEPEPVAVAPAGAGGTYSLEQLKTGCPAGVVASAKEQSLNDGDFKEVFGMTKDEFTKLPMWKQKAAKQKAGLF